MVSTYNNCTFYVNKFADYEVWTVDTVRAVDIPTTTSLGRLKKLLNRPCKVVVNSYKFTVLGIATYWHGVIAKSALIPPFNGLFTLL